jgi:cation diffusion facilitator family transporter
MAISDLIPQLQRQHLRKLSMAKRVTAIGMAVSGSLSITKLIVGWLAHSTAVFADGLENMGDLFGSGLVLYALYVASKPPDKEHPYGHGRSETIAGLAVGFLLAASGILKRCATVYTFAVLTQLNAQSIARCVPKILFGA